MIKNSKIWLNSYFNQYPQGTYTKQLEGFLKTGVPAVQEVHAFRKAVQEKDLKKASELAAKIKENLNQHPNSEEAILGTSLTPAAILTEVKILSSAQQSVQSNIDNYFQAQELLEKVQQLADDKRWEELLRYSDTIDTHASLQTESGERVKKKILDLIAKAELALEESKDLQEKAKAAHSQKQYEQALEFTQQCLDLNPFDKDSSDRKEKLVSSIQKQEDTKKAEDEQFAQIKRQAVDLIQTKTHDQELQDLVE